MPTGTSLLAFAAAALLLRAGVAVAVALLTACGKAADSRAPTNEEYGAVLHFDTATVRLASAADTHRITVELAENPEQQALGLMERRTLAQDAGMLFLYATAQSESSAFWMFRTRIPLDIAFVDSAGLIRTIRSMEPCTSELAQACPSYPAGAPYRAALEVNRGWFAARRIGVGARLFLEDTSRRRLGRDVR
jgi:uncharacterized protein